MALAQRNEMIWGHLTAFSYGERPALLQRFSLRYVDLLKLLP